MVYVASKYIAFVIMRPYILNPINTKYLLDFVSCCPMALVHKNTSIRLYKNACDVKCIV